MTAARTRPAHATGWGPVLWPSFLAASVVTIAATAGSDPAHWLECLTRGGAGSGTDLLEDPLAGYSLFFLSAWAGCALSSAATAYLTRPASDPRTPPGAGNEPS